MLVAGFNVDALHVTPEAVREVLLDAHRIGFLPHHWFLDIGDQVLEVSLGAIRRCWIGDSQRTGSGRNPVVSFPLMADAPMLFSFRSSRNVGDEGQCGFGTVNLAVLFEPPAHQGKVPEKFAHSIRLDFSVTQESDVTLPANLNGSGARLRTAIVDFIHQTFSGTYPLPDGALSALSQATPIEVLTVTEPDPQLVIRPLSPLRDPKGRRLQISRPSGVHFGSAGGARWQAVIGPDNTKSYFASQLAKLVLPASTTNDQIAANMEFKFSDGQVQIFTSRPSTKSTRFLIRAASIVESMPAWEVDSGEQRERISISGGSFAKQGQADSKGDGSGIGNRSALRFMLASHEIRNTGLHISGLVQQSIAEAPMAEFVWFRQPQSARTVTFYGLGSWAPASEIVEVSWDFGDGAAQSSKGNFVALVVSHTYLHDGPFDVRLRVADALGRTNTVIKTVSPSSLQITASAPIRSIDGSLISLINIRSGNAPLINSDVTIDNDQLGTVSLRTDENGQVLIRSEFGTFAGNIVRTDRSKRRLGIAANLFVTVNDRRWSFSISVMDAATYSAVLEITLLSSKLVTHGRSDLDPALARQLSRKARALKFALWRGYAPSWWHTNANQVASPRVSADEIRAMGQTVSRIASTIASRRSSSSE